MKRLFLFLSLSFAICNAHVKLYYTGLPIRNAMSTSGDGTFTTDNLGGNGKFGANGKGSVTVGDTITLKFNYGTGTNGDHADASNVFRVTYSKDGDNRTLLTNQKYPGSSTLAKPEGSTAAPGQLTVTIPFDFKGCEKCSIAVLDQRNWGGVVDFQVSDTVPDDVLDAMGIDENGNPVTGPSKGAIAAAVLIPLIIVAIIGACIFMYVKYPTQFRSMRDNVSSGVSTGVSKVRGLRGNRPSPGASNVRNSNRSRSHSRREGNGEESSYGAPSSNSMYSSGTYGSSPSTYNTYGSGTTNGRVESGYGAPVGVRSTPPPPPRGAPAGGPPPVPYSAKPRVGFPAPAPPAAPGRPPKPPVAPRPQYNAGY